MSFAPFSIKVPGKAILFGEHAVVYGQAAIAMPVQRFLTLNFTPRSDAVEQPVLVASDWDLRLDLAAPAAGTETLVKALEAGFGQFPQLSRAVHMELHSEIPRSAGLGSSAALAVALVRGLSKIAGQKDSIEQNVNQAMKIEKIFHGNPSGIDHSVIAFAQPIKFSREQGLGLDVKLANSLEFVVAVVGSHGGTAARVGALAARRERWPVMFQPLMQQIGQIAEQGLQAMQDGDLEQIGALMDINQGLLNALGLSSPDLERAVAVAREAGALGAKLSGAGGGGAMIALCQDKAQEVQQALEALGFVVFRSFVAAQ